MQELRADAIVEAEPLSDVLNVAADRLGEVVFAELPQVGDTVTAGETCGEVESTKSVSDLYSPVTGTVTAEGECEAERIRAQLQETAAAHTSAGQVRLEVDGRPLDDVLGRLAAAAPST